MANPADTIYLDLERPMSEILTVYRYFPFIATAQNPRLISHPSSRLTLVPIPLYYHVLAFKLDFVRKMFAQ